MPSLTRRLARRLSLVLFVTAMFWLPPQPAHAQSRSDDTGWDLALTGGVAVSGLTDPVWALGTVPGRAIRVVLRDTDSESTARLSITMFAQVYNSQHWPWLSPVSIGLGLNDHGHATFFLGPGLRFGSHASIVGGLAVGPVAALPAGVVEQQPITDSNFLIDLSTRTTASWFAGFTYTFATIR